MAKELKDTITEHIANTRLRKSQIYFLFAGLRSLAKFGAVLEYLESITKSCLFIYLWHGLSYKSAYMEKRNVILTVKVANGGMRQSENCDCNCLC